MVKNKSMKKLILLSAVLFFGGLNIMMAQFTGINPIPSYNFQMTTEYAGFEELGPVNQTREKRDMTVEVTTSSRDETRISATVWMVKKNSTKVLGPYTIYVNELLSVEIDNGKWGVIIQCGSDINVSVWTETVRFGASNDIQVYDLYPVFTLSDTFPVI
jgi:hypothetical protein